MRVRAVESGPAAFAYLDEVREEETRFDLCVLDRNLPGMDGFAVAQVLQRRPDTRQTRILMLAAGGRPGDGAKCRELGIAGYLGKPVDQAALLEGAIKVLSLGADDEPPTRPVTRHTLRESGRPLRILVAEDNPINQKLAVRILGKWGHETKVAANGRAVLAQLEAEEFDLVLMDVQMPELDGLAATREIRAREQATGRHLPIIAMTANAMKGDREACLAAGMDAYIAKPIRIEELYAAIETTLAATATGNESVTVGSS